MAVPSTNWMIKLPPPVSSLFEDDVQQREENVMNEVLLRRKNMVVLHTGNAVVPNDRYIITIMKNIEDLGYTFSKEVFAVLRTYTDKELVDFYFELKPELMKLVGSDVIYRPMYADFPKGVMDERFSELYLNAMIHYWSGGILYPAKNRKRVNARLPLFEETKVKVIRLGREDDVKRIFNDLCMSRTSISMADREDIAYLFEHDNMMLPDNIPHKENAAYIAALYLQKNPTAGVRSIRKYIKTATDVLRLATALSDGDVSLAENTRYKSFNRRQRRLIMELLSGCDNIEEDMLRYKERWIRIGERIHPSEFECSRHILEYDKAISAFDNLRNNKKIETFGNKVELALAYGDYTSAIAELVKRPGEFARRLDQLLRKSDDKTAVIDSFRLVADKVSTPVLLQLREHFANRAEHMDVRVFFPKGNLAECHCVTNELPDIDDRYCRLAVGICENALVGIYSHRETMGKVYLSESYKNFVVPFSQRSASKSLKTIVRGSRLPIQDQTNAIRAFIWWTNMDGSSLDADTSGRVDIDLSAVMFDEQWNYMEHISYTHLKSEQFNSCHSGDIVNGGPVDGDGVSEFLDFDIDSVVRYGARYVVYQLYCYTGQAYADMPHAMFGWMARSDVRSGEIYEPKTVEQKMDLTSNSTVCIPVIFDCVDREIIWCDMNLPISGCHSHIGGNNLESNLSGVVAVCYSMVNMRKPNLYDLVTLNVKGRGILTTDRSEADIVFDVSRSTDDENVITPFDTEVFMGLQ